MIAEARLYCSDASAGAALFSVLRALGSDSRLLRLGAWSPPKKKPRLDLAGEFVSDATNIGLSPAQRKFLGTANPQAHFAEAASSSPSPQQLRIELQGLLGDDLGRKLGNRTRAAAGSHRPP